MSVNWGFGGLVSRGLLLLLASLTLLSLASYHPNDPNLLSGGSVGGYSNWCGFIGANLAGLPVAFLGLGAWLLPFYIAWEALRGGREGWQKRAAWLALGLSVWTILGSAGDVMWPPRGGAGADRIHCGGWVGYIAWPSLRKVLGPVGSPATLAATLAMASAILAPRATKAIGRYFAGRLGWASKRLLARPILAISSRGAKAFLGMAARPFLLMRQVRQKAAPEIDAADARDLRALDEQNQAVEALGRAEREAAAFRRLKNRLPKEMDYPTIHSVNLDAIRQEPEPTPIQPIELERADFDAGLPDVLTVAQAPKKYDGPLPRAALLRDVPPPPRYEQVVEPRMAPDGAGGTVEQPPLGLSVPLPPAMETTLKIRPVRIGAAPPPDAMETTLKMRPVRMGAAQIGAERVDRLDLPPRRLFDPPGAGSSRADKMDRRALEETGTAIQRKLAEFKVRGRMTGMQPGPVVTVYEFSPDAGVPLSKVLNMEEDLALGLRAEKIRIDRIPGKNVVGIEVPNASREVIGFREILDSPEFLDAPGERSFLHLVLGKDMGGRPVVADLAKMPHLLIGGSTGSGKSVGVNAMICSMLLRARADEVKLILIDPKMVELGVYEDIPHLWAPVVTDMKEAGRVLKWVVAQMDDRYRRLTLLTARNLEQFNTKVIEAGGAIDISDRTPNPKWPDRPQRVEPLPYVVVVIDELADLMMVCRSEVEESIARIAQKARAVGIHLVLATQRPSVDIVTGVIKANLPARLSYRVNTKIDSRTILDSGGGEQLLGKGDALFLAPGTARPRRIHAPLITEDEIVRLVEWLRERGRPDYNAALIQAMETEADGAAGHGGDGQAQAGDDVYDRAVAVVRRERKASTSLLQRKLNIGYGRAARLIDRMEDEGLVGPDRGAGKPREVFADAGVGE
jgi:S-DNA-T family DNA segregation ATPase FtsK/SpoIIIE